MDQDYFHAIFAFRIYVEFVQVKFNEKEDL